MSAVRRAIEGRVDPAAAPVILTQPDIRRFVKKLIETDVPTARVVSYAELLPEITIKPLGKATLVGL